MKFKSGKSRVVMKTGLLLLLVLLSWFSFESTRTANASVQDRYFSGPFPCSCWHDGGFEYGCGFRCYMGGNDCYESAHCFCPCVY